MDSFTWCINGNGCNNGTASKWVPTLFCAAAAVAKYFALTLHYCTIAAAAQCEYFQQQCNENKKKSQLLPHSVNTFSSNAMKTKKIAAAAAPCEWTLNPAK